MTTQNQKLKSPFSPRVDQPQVSQMNDIENTQKAVHSAQFLISDLREMAKSGNPFLSDMAIGILKSAAEVESSLEKALSLLSAAAPEACVATTEVPAMPASIGKWTFEEFRILQERSQAAASPDNGDQSMESFDPGLF